MKGFQFSLKPLLELREEEEREVEVRLGQSVSRLNDLNQKQDEISHLIRNTSQKKAFNQDFLQLSLYFERLRAEIKGIESQKKSLEEQIKSLREEFVLAHQKTQALVKLKEKKQKEYKKKVLTHEMKVLDEISQVMADQKSRIDLK